MDKYVIMGVQGSGKGTQAELLATDLNLEHINVGDIFRWNVQHHSKLGAQVRRIVAAGELVPDALVQDVVRTRLDEHDWNFGFLVDGFPRNPVQARFLLESYNVDSVIHIEVPDGKVAKRVLARRLCSRCGLDYNLIFHRPTAPGTCDVCGGELVQRPDDTPKALANRLRDYHTQTEPVLELFAAKGLVVTVDGTKPALEVQAEIRDRLGLPAYQPEDPASEAASARSAAETE